MRVLAPLVWSLTAAVATGVAVPAVAADASSADWTYTGDAAEAPVLRWDEGAVVSDISALNGREPLALSSAPVLTPQGLYEVQASETWFGGPDGSVDRFRVTTGALAPGAFAPALRDNDGRFAGDVDAYDVSYTRGWPGAMSMRSGRYALDVTPHAGFGMTSLGGSAEAGATVRFGEDDALSRLGVKDGAVFGEQGRWYLFAAASGRAVGYNFLRGGDGWRRSGVSTDDGAFIGDAQAGVAWRKGKLQASFGYVHREVKAQGVRAVDTSRDESLVAFTLSIKPTR